MKKRKYDEMSMRLTQDRDGFTAFAYEFSYRGAPSDTIIISDCSHRKAMQRIYTVIEKKFEYDPPSETTPTKKRNEPVPPPQDE